MPPSKRADVDGLILHRGNPARPCRPRQARSDPGHDRSANDHRSVRTNGGRSPPLSDGGRLPARSLVTPERLGARVEALRKSGRPGAGRLARAPERGRSGSALESVLEAKVWLLVRRCGVPLPRRQFWVALPGGRYRLDFAWPDRQRRDRVRRLGASRPSISIRARSCSSRGVRRGALADPAGHVERVHQRAGSASNGGSRRALAVGGFTARWTTLSVFNRAMNQSMGTLRTMRPSMRSKISSRLWPVMVRPWLRWPTTARLGSGASRTSSATDCASSTVPHG